MNINDMVRAAMGDVRTATGNATRLASSNNTKKVSPSNPRPANVSQQRGYAGPPTVPTQHPSQRLAPAGKNVRGPQTADALGIIPAPKKAGKFLQNAYASYNAAPKKKPPAADAAYAMKEFKSSHKWARESDPSKNRDLEFAVRYLLLKPKVSKKYYNP